MENPSWPRVCIDDEEGCDGNFLHQREGVGRETLRLDSLGIGGHQTASLDLKQVSWPFQRPTQVAIRNDPSQATVCIDDTGHPEAFARDLEDDILEAGILGDQR